MNLESGDTITQEISSKIVCEQGERSQGNTLVDMIKMMDLLHSFKIE